MACRLQLETHIFNPKQVLTMKTQQHIWLFDSAHKMWTGIQEQIFFHYNLKLIIASILYSGLTHLWRHKYMLALCCYIFEYWDISEYLFKTNI